MYIYIHIARLFDRLHERLRVSVGHVEADSGHARAPLQDFCSGGRHAAVGSRIGPARAFG